MAARFRRSFASAEQKRAGRKRKRKSQLGDKATAAVPPTLLKYCGGKKGSPHKGRDSKCRNKAAPRFFFVKPLCYRFLPHCPRRLPEARVCAVQPRLLACLSSRVRYPPALSTLPSLSIINSPSPAHCSQTQGGRPLPLLLFRPGSYSPSLLCEAVQKKPGNHCRRREEKTAASSDIWITARKTCGE